MWVHLDLVHEVTQPTTKKRSGKVRSCRTVSANEEEVTAVVTRSGAQSQPVAENPTDDHPPTSTDAPGPAQPSMTDKPRPRETRFDKSLRKEAAQGLEWPYNFDILAQLANKSAKLSLYELLRLSKDFRTALSDALQNADAYLAQVNLTGENPPADLQDSACTGAMPNIVFTP